MRFVRRFVGGCFPIYVDVFSEENDFALTFVAHRIVWSFVVLIGMLLVGKLTGLRSGWLIPDHTEARQNLGRPRVIGLVLLACRFHCIELAVICLVRCERAQD